MGWKASFVVAAAEGPGYLGSLPAHRPERARELVGRLFPAYREQDLSTFEAGIHPDADELYVGAYDLGVLVCQPDLAEAALRPGDPVVAELARRFPAVLTVGLHSVVDYVGYAYFEAGALVRAYAGTLEDGVVVDQGAPLPEEEGLPGVEDGEERAFRLTSRFFGVPLDQFDVWDLTLGRYVRRRGLFRR
jgi:hypothetical protein